MGLPGFYVLPHDVAAQAGSSFGDVLRSFCNGFTIDFTSAWKKYSGHKKPSIRHRSEHEACRKRRLPCQFIWFDDQRIQAAQLGFVFVGGLDMFYAFWSCDILCLKNLHQMDINPIIKLHQNDIRVKSTPDT